MYCLSIYITNSNLFIIKEFNALFRRQAQTVKSSHIKITFGPVHSWTCYTLTVDMKNNDKSKNIVCIKISVNLYYNRLTKLILRDLKI